MQQLKSGVLFMSAFVQLSLGIFFMEMAFSTYESSSPHEPSFFHHQAGLRRGLVVAR